MAEEIGEKFWNKVDKNDIFNVHGGKLDVILVREGFHEVFVSGIDGIVQPDAYHPPLDVEVRVESVLCSNVMDPSNINPARDWNFYKCDYVQLFSLLSETSWDSVLRAVSVADAVNAFYQIIYDTFDACMPKKRRSGRVAERYPVWFTSDIIQDIKRKLALHAAWKRSKCLEQYKTFSDLRCSLKHRVATAYQTYIKRVENNIRVNPREFWRHICSLRSKGGFEPSVSYLSRRNYKRGFNMLDTRRNFDQLHIALKIYRGIIDAPDLHNELVRLYAPNNYIRARRHRLLSVPACRTVARASSPIPRVLSALNSLMEAYPDCDLFVDELKTIKRVCLSFCESL
ncbi:hypothetical protein SFRURICE_019873 [Spodoptera frugiperda]|nr:hypothetical protein SFRURICE_019873 [Spodoptera frugiperda]